MKYLFITAILLLAFSPSPNRLPLKIDNRQSDSCLISISESRFFNQQIPDEDMSYVYDDQGRIMVLKSTDAERTYTYMTNEIVEKYLYTDDGRKNLVIMHHKLDSKGRIISSDNPLVSVKYSYDENGYLDKAIHFGNSIYQMALKYIIINGNLQRIEKNIDAENSEDIDPVEVTLSHESFPGNFHYLIKDLPFEFTGPLRYYYGKPLKKLISKTESSGLSPVFYTYKKDKQGNVIQAKSTVTYEKIETDVINIKYTCK